MVHAECGNPLTGWSPQVFGLLIVVSVLAACNSTDSGVTASSVTDDAPPFGQPPTGTLIHFTAPIETATTSQRPRSVTDRALVSPGAVRFAWTPVIGADAYILMANEVTGAGSDADRRAFPVQLYVETEDTTVDATLEDAFDDGLSLALLVQVFAYQSGELIGMSDAWGIEVEQ